MAAVMALALTHAFGWVLAFAHEHEQEMVPTHAKTNKKQ